MRRRRRPPPPSRPRAPPRPRRPRARSRSLAGRPRMSGAIDIPSLIRQIPTQYPFVLVDRVLEHEPGGRLVALKNVTGSEEFFQGHFPGAPVMPGVLLMEGLAQAAGILL